MAKELDVSPSRYCFNQNGRSKKLLLSCMIELSCRIKFSAVDESAFDDGY